MKEITLYHNGSAQMRVMSLGKAIDWNPQTTLNFYEDEAKKLLVGYEHIKQYEDAALSKTVDELQKENEALKAEINTLKGANVLDREALKSEAEDLGIKFQANIPTTKLKELIEEGK